MSGREISAPCIAAFVCSAAERDPLIASIQLLAGELGGAVKLQDLDSAGTAILAYLPAETAARFTAALLLGGATFLPEPGRDRGAITILVSTKPTIENRSLE